MFNLNVVKTRFYVANTILNVAKGHGSQHGKNVRNMGKALRNIAKVVRNIYTFSQHDRNIVTTWGRREEKLLMLDVASNRVRNIFATRLQHARNIYSADVKSNG
jgi:hypothetical protein